MSPTAPVGATIHLVADGNLVRLEACPCACETHLQSLLAEYPELLAGDQIDRQNPRRWLLVGRELFIPADEGNEGRWPVDHLFIDQDVIPTIVEVKRGMNTRTRRELIGQIFDYAASNWHVETLRAQFVANCAATGRDPNASVHTLIGDASDAGQFWARVETNLRTGRLRLIIVADFIPADLLRVVDFLNSQMGSVEVLAVEVRQFTGQGQTALISRLVSRVIGGESTKVSPGKPTVQMASGPVGIDRGESVEALPVLPRGQMPTPSSVQWDEPSFLAAMAARSGAEEAAIARKLIAWATEHKLQLRWGMGKPMAVFG